MRNPLSAESDLRKLLRAECGPMSSVTLERALGVASSFYRSVRDFDTDGEEGDGFVIYEDVTHYGKGTRLEVGIVRVFCLPEVIGPFQRRSAVRLRLRCCYRIDHAIVSEVLAEPTWSLHCWSPVKLDEILCAARETAAFKVLSSCKAAAVHIATEHATYWPSTKNPRPDAKQIWWAVVNVA